MALRRQIVDLLRLHLLHDAHQAGGVGEIPIVQDEPAILFVRILIEMIDAVGVEERSAPLDAMHLVALVEKEFRKIGAVLPGNSGNQSSLQECTAPIVKSAAAVRAPPRTVHRSFYDTAREYRVRE